MSLKQFTQLEEKKKEKRKKNKNNNLNQKFGNLVFWAKKLEELLSNSHICKKKYTLAQINKTNLT